MGENDNDNAGWIQWSKHVLKELERLNNSYENLRDELKEIPEKISTKIDALKEKEIAPLYDRIDNKIAAVIKEEIKPLNETVTAIRLKVAYIATIISLAVSILTALLGGLGKTIIIKLFG